MAQPFVSVSRRIASGQMSLAIRMLLEERERGEKIAHVSNLFDSTSAKVDEWAPEAVTFWSACLVLVQLFRGLGRISGTKNPQAPPILRRISDVGSSLGLEIQHALIVAQIVTQK